MSVTRLPTGLATRKTADPLGNYTRPDPTDAHQYMEDFDVYTAGQWTITVVGTSVPALTAGDGGLLNIPVSAANNDSSFLQKTTEGYSFEVGKPMWFSTRFKVSALTTVALAGLQVTDTTPEDATDGIYFISTTVTGAITGIVRKNGTTGSASVAVGNLAADTFTELAWYWDGKDTVQFYQDRVHKGSITGVAANYLPDTTATVSFGVRSATAAVKSMVVDYVLASKSRR